GDRLVRRAEAADRHRPGTAEETQAAPARRGDVAAGRGRREGAAGDDRRGRGGGHGVSDRAPAVHRGGRRRGARPRKGADPGPGDGRRADRRGRGLPPVRGGAGDGVTLYRTLLAEEAARPGSWRRMRSRSSWSVGPGAVPRAASSRSGRSPKTARASLVREERGRAIIS